MKVEGGEAANDRLTVNGLDGDDLIDVSEVPVGQLPVDVQGAAGDDILLGGAGTNTLAGADGDDILFSGTGTTVADGGTGSNVVF